MDEAQIKRDIAIVCQCKAIRHKTIRLAIEAGATTLDKIRKQTKANTGCGKNCTERILEMIAQYRKK
jgi:NAD(P)H-nitrite reductase large subunit